MNSRFNRNIEDRYYSQREFHRCALKLRHTDYFSAILHINSMRKEIPLATPHIYECEFCDGLHVSSGKSHKDYFKLKHSLERLEEGIKHPGYAAKAPSWIQAKDAQIVLDLRVRLAELEVAYRKRKGRAN